MHQGLASVLQPSGVLAGDPTCQRLSAAREKVPRRTRVVAKKTLANRLKKGMSLRPAGELSGSSAVPLCVCWRHASQPPQLP